jgi:hypothetical protein
MARPGPSGLPPEEIVRRIKKALARDKTHTWDHVCDLLAVGAAQIFWNEHGAWITEIVQTPISRWLHVWIVAGELPGVMDLQGEVLEYARQQNCQHVTATARFGWKHVAKAHGWHQHAMVIKHDV